MSALTCWFALSWPLVVVAGALAKGADEPPRVVWWFATCGAVAAFFGALAGIGSLMLRVEGKRGRRRAERLIGEALLKANQQADPQSTQSLLQDALRASPAIDLPDLERLADQRQVPLSDGVRSALRRAELRYLQELLASPEHLPKRVEGDAIQIERSGAGIDSPKTASRLRPNPLLGIEVTERAIDGRRTLDITLTVRTAGPMVYRGAQYGAFVSKSELPKSEDVVTVLDAEKRIKSDIARRFRKEVSAVLRTIVEFGKGRRLMAELDQVVIHERKYVPVIWFENVTSTAEILLGQTALRTHYWGRLLMADFVVTIDLAPLSEGGSVPWDFKEEQVRFEYVPV